MAHNSNNYPYGYNNRQWIFKVEPSKSVFARNLFAKHDWRAVLSDEMEPMGPKMPLVNDPCSSACRGERLAWAAPCPDWFVVGPSCEPESVGPHGDTREEVALVVPFEIVWPDITYIPPVHIAVRNEAPKHEVLYPFSSVWINLVVIRSHHLILRKSRVVRSQPYDPLTHRPGLLKGNVVVETVGRIVVGHPALDTAEPILA